MLSAQVQSTPKVDPHRPHRSVSVVIPAKNEARNIAWVLERIPSFVDEVIVVDGLSSDGTLDVARMVVPDIVVIHEMQPGKGSALRAGFAAARGDYVVMLDADGSMNPAEITSFVALLDEGYDFVKGSRYLPGGGTTDMTWLRSFGNRRLLDLANVMYGASFTELCYGYCAFRRQALHALELDAVGFEVETQIVVRAIRRELRIAEVPSNEAPRLSGESNLHAFTDGLRVLRTLIQERFGSARRPPQFGRAQAIGVEVEDGDERRGAPAL